jgi:hypothetical protein
MRRIVTLFLVVLCGSLAYPKGRSGSHSSRTPKAAKVPKAKKARTSRASGTSLSRGHTHSYRRGYAAEGYSLHPTVARDRHGRIKRSRAARSEFQREKPCPSTGKTSGRCPGYVVDHIKALECGGPDSPTNMQWQTTADAKAKDKTERRCRI